MRLRPSGSPSLRYRLLSPPSRRGCSRQPGLFSEQNARAHVGMLAGTIGSRPIGTPANARARAYIVDQLRLFGFEVRVQDADARARGARPHARASPTSSPSVPAGARKRSALLSHYDSVPAGPGAADDALGVGGVAGGGARAGCPRRSQLDADGARHRRRRSGLMGAAALDDRSRRHRAACRRTSTSKPSDRRQRRCCSRQGPATAGCSTHGRATRRSRAAASFGIEIYRRLPNDTDFSILKRHEIPGPQLRRRRRQLRLSHDAGHTGAPVARTVRETRRAGRRDRDGARRRRHHAAIEQPTRTFFDIAGASAMSYGPTGRVRLSPIAALVLGVIAWVQRHRGGDSARRRRCDGC